MADPIRISNWFSPLDTETIIEKLTDVRMAKVRRLDVQQVVANQRKSAIADIVTNLSALLGKANVLTGATSVSGRSAAVTGTAVAVAAGPAAALGTFTISVGKLASGTKATGTALSAALDAASPMSASNFATAPTNGTFTIATATGGSRTFSVGPAVADTVSTLSAANLAVTPTTGTFTIGTAGGGSAVINVDAATQSLQDVVNSINAAGVGVTASITNGANGRANILSLASVSGDITLGDVADTSNFLTATSLLGSAAGPARASTAAFTVGMSLDEVLAEINASGIGVTATVANDANGRANLVSMVSTQGAITLGTGGDTSNFLDVTNLAASPGTTTRVSTQSVARLNASAKLEAASLFGGPFAAGAHTFTINGVSIAYNTATDSLNDIVSRINSSAAGVTARYDTTTDKLSLEQTKTGSLGITLADDGTGGDFLARTGLLGAIQALGANAECAINGGPTRYATSNTVNPLPGITVTLNALTEVGSPATVTVTQDAASAVTAVKDFVSAFNTVFGALSSVTKADGSATNNQSGILSGDGSIRQLASTLRSLVTSAGLNVPGSLSNLAQLGVSFGAIGSAVGTTGALQFDETKFKDALAKDPAGVQQVLSGLTLAASLTPGGTGSVAGMTGSYTGTRAGVYAITDDGAGHLTAVFTPADGGAPLTSNATVVAGGTNTTLIPGMTLQIAGGLVGGTHTIAVTPTTSGVIQQLRQFLENQVGAGALLAKRQDAYDAIAKDLDARKLAAEEHINNEMDILRRKFAALDEAQARAQAVMAALQQAMTRLSTTQ
jgi:flagellar hook-associated protein 2